MKIIYLRGNSFNFEVESLICKLKSNRVNIIGISSLKAQFLKNNIEEINEMYQKSPEFLFSANWQL